MKLKKLLKTRTFRQIISYGIVGSMAVLLDYTVYTIVRLTLSSVTIPMANFLAMLSGATFAFFMNRKFTFSASDYVVRRLTIFIAVGLCGYGLSTWIIITGISIGINEWIVKAFAILVVAAIQFTINKFVTFKQT
jgi:putative flippase GtrA